MFNLYISNNSFYETDIDEIENCLKELNSIIVESNDLDNFWKNESIYHVIIKNKETFGNAIFNLITDKQFSYQVLPILLNKIKNTEREYVCVEDFDRDYIIFNAFYGINFQQKDSRYFTNYNEYNLFKNKCIKEDLHPEFFVKIKDISFPNLIFSDLAIKQVSELKDQDLFIVVMLYLLYINKSVEDYWKEGFYDYQEANKKYPLKMSLESESTMKNRRLSRMRYFSFPDGKERCCELHAKINRNKFRIHIFPETLFNISEKIKKNKIHIGYIGEHLETSDT